MQFYDVLAGGNRTALTRTQIAGLFQAGQLACNDPCKEAERAEWRTIDELFPLLKHGTTARSLYQPTELHSSRGRTIALATAISILVISASLAGYFALRSGASGPKNAITAKAAANPPAPVSYTIENPYFLSQKARAEQERLNAAQRAREQTQAARLAQDRADAERRERELQTAADDAKSPSKGSQAAKREETLINSSGHVASITSGRSAESQTTACFECATSRTGPIRMYSRPGPIDDSALPPGRRVCLYSGVAAQPAAVGIFLRFPTLFGGCLSPVC